MGGHAWINLNPLLRTVFEKNPTGKRPLKRLCLKWDNLVRRDVEALGGGMD